MQFTDARAHGRRVRSLPHDAAYTHSGVLRVSQTTRHAQRFATNGDDPTAEATDAKKHAEVGRVGLTRPQPPQREPMLVPRAMRPKSAHEFRSQAPASNRAFRPQSARPTVSRYRPLSATTGAAKNGTATLREPVSSPRLRGRSQPDHSAGGVVHAGSRKENEIQHQFDVELGRIKNQIQKERTVTTDFVATINDCAQHFYHSNSCAPWRHPR